MGKTITVNAKAIRASQPSMRFYVADAAAPVPHGVYLEYRLQTDVGTEDMKTYACESTADGVTFTPIAVLDHTGATILSAAAVTQIRNAFVAMHPLVAADAGY